MKRTMILLPILLAAVVAFAQDKGEEDEIKTIVGRGVKLTGYGAFDMNLTKILDRNTLLTGGHGGIIVDKKYVLGLGGYGISTPVQFQGLDPQEDLRLVGGYGGVMLGYVLMPREVLHVTFPLFLGVGGMQVVDPSFAYDPNSGRFNDTVEKAMFYVVEPGVQAEVNVARFMRMSLGVGYRLTSGVDLPKNEIDDEDTSGMTVNLSFKFGIF